MAMRRMHSKWIAAVLAIVLVASAGACPKQLRMDEGGIAVSPQKDEVQVYAFMTIGGWFSGRQTWSIQGVLGPTQENDLMVLQDLAKKSLEEAVLVLGMSDDSICRYQGADGAFFKAKEVVQ